MGVCMLPTSQELIYFIELAQTLNMSRSAEKLGVTQPTLTSSLKKLESNLGTLLFVRSKSGIQLTKFGERFFPEAKELLEKWNSLSIDVKKHEVDIQGQFSIGLHQSVAQYSLPLFLPALLKKYSDLSFSFHHDLSRKITENIISYKMDFGIVINPVSHPDLIIKELCHDEVTFFKSKDCKNNDILIYEPDMLQSQSLLRESKKKKIEFSRHLTSSSLEVIRGLVASGAGIGILPARVAHFERSHHLVEAFSNAPTFKDRLCLIYRRMGKRTKAQEVISQAIINAF